MESGGDNLGTIFLDVLLDTSKISAQINELQKDPRINVNPIKVGVDITQLHELNQTLDRKNQHLRQTIDNFRNNPIVPRVELSQLHELNKLLDRVGTNKAISIDATVKYKDERSGGSGGGNPGVISGFQQEIGRQLVGVVSDGLKRNFGYDSKQSADRMADKIATPIKLFVTDNPELGKAIERTARTVEDRLRKAGYVVGEAIVQSLDRENATIRQRIETFTAAVAPNAQRAVQTVKADVDRISKDLFSSTFNSTNTSTITSQIEANLRAYKEAALRDLAIPKAVDRAQQISNKGRVKDTGNVVTSSTNELIIATGGYAGARGLSGKALARDIKQDVSEGTQVIWVANKDSDISKESMGDAASKTKALITSMSKPNLRGYSNDAVEMAAQALVALQKNPQVKIKFLGESGGGDPAAEAAKMLQMMGAANVSYLGVGTPDFIGGHKANGRKIISPDEYLGAETHQTYAKFGFARTQSPSTNILGVDGHPYENYRDAKVAELENFLKGKPSQLSIDDVRQIKGVANSFQAIDTKGMSGKEIETLGKQAYANLQLIRRHLVDAIGEPNQELAAIAKQFESVYIANASEPRTFTQVRSALTKSKEILDRIAEQPGIEAAQIAGQLNKELLQIQAEFSTQNKGQVGTLGQKYTQIDRQLQASIDRSGDPAIAIPFAARALPPAPIVRAEQPTQQDLAVASKIGLAIPDRVKELAVQSLTLVASGTVNVVGKAIGAAYGAEKALLGKGGANTVNALAAAVGVSQLPGGQALLGATGTAIGGLANIPASALAGQTAEGISQILTQVAGNLPLLKGAIPQASEAIAAALQSGAAGASTTIGQLLAPFAVGAGAVKALSAGANRLPGFDPIANGAIAGAVQNQAARLIGAGGAGVNRLAGLGVRAIAPGSEIIDAEIIEGNFPALAGGLNRSNQLALRPANKLTSNVGSIDPSDSNAIQTEVDRIKKIIRSEKEQILKNLKSSDPTQIEQGLMMAGELGIGQGILKQDLRALVDKARSARNQLVEDNPSIAKKGNIPGYSNLLRSQQVAQAMADDKGAATKPIVEQVQKLQNDPSLIAKISPALKQGAIGAGAFASIIAALTTGAQAATVGGGAVAGGGLLAALSPLLLPALGIGAVGAAGYAGYRSFANPSSNKFGSINDPDRMKNAIGAIPDPPEPENDPAIATGVKNKFGGFARMLGSAVVGLIGFQVASMALPVATEFLKESIGKALGSANLNLAIKSTSTSNNAFQETLAASQSLSQKLNTSEIAIRESLSSFQANIADTPLEGQGNSIIGGLQKYGRLLGVDGQRLNLASRALSQSAGKGQLYSEEVFGQLAESLPGGAVQLAGASGLSVKQLRALLKSGGADAADMLSRFGGRLNAIGDMGLEGFENTPQAKLGKFGTSVENLQVKLGESTLAPLATGADIASKAIDLLANSLGLLGSIGAAALIKLAIDSGVAGAALTGLKGALDWGTLTQGIKGAETALKGFAASPVGKMVGELALVTAAIESLKLVGDIFSGGNTPGRAIADDMARAAQGIEKLTKSAGELDKTSVFRNRDNFYAKSKNYAENFADLTNPFLLLGGESSITNKKVVQDRQQLIEGLEKGEKAIDSARSYQPAPEDLQKLRSTNRELQILKIREATATGLDPQELQSLTDQISSKLTERTKLEQPIQSQLVGLQGLQKTYKSIVEDPFYSSDPAFAKITESARAELARIEPQIERFQKILAETTIESAKTALSLQEMNYRFGQSQIQIDRTNTEKFIQLTDGFSGSLLKGARATAEYEIKLSTLNAKMSAGARAASDAREVLAAPEVKAQIQTLREGGKYKLPDNLNDVTDEQLKNLETEAKVNKQTIAALRANRDYSSQFLKLKQEESALLDQRRTALAEERKAAREYYFNTVTESKKLELASIESTRAIQQASLASKFKVSLTGISSAVGNYVNTLVDTFTELGNLTKIENERKQKEYDLQVQKIKTKIDFTNRNNTSSEPVPEGAIRSNATTLQTVMSPIVGTTLDAAIGRRPTLGMQSAEATRPMAGGGTRPHAAIDYGSALGVKLGTPVQAVIDGTATYTPRVGYGYGKGRNHVTSQVILEGKYTDENGEKKVKFQYFHLGEESAKYFKDGFTRQVKAGDVIGQVGADGKIGGNENHLHFASWLNGKRVNDPRKVLEKLQSGRTAMPESRSIAKPDDTSKIVSESGLQSLLIQELATGKIVKAYRSETPPASPASTLKLIVAKLVQDAVAQGKASTKERITLDESSLASGDKNRLGKSYSIAELLTDTLKNSSNTSANALIQRLGGVESANRRAQELGFKGTSIKNLFSIPGGRGFENKSTAIDTSRALRELYLDDSAIGALSRNALENTPNKFGYQGEVGGKIGNNSRVLGNVGVVKISGKLYTIAEYFNTPDSAKARRNLKSVNDRLVRSISADAATSLPMSAPSISSPSSATSRSEYTPVTATVYFPGEGNIKMEGEKKDIYGKYIDRNSLVAATRTTDIKGLGLPYGSVIEIRNPKNGKTTKLTVNDRGTLQPGVDIDITPAATNALGIKADGKNQLEMRVISTPKPISEYNLGSGKGKYDVKGYTVNYVGPLGRRILVSGVPDRFEQRQPYQGKVPQPMKYTGTPTFKPTPGAIPDPTQGSGFPTNESIRQDNLNSYKVQTDSIERQRRINEENSKELASMEIFKANAQLRKAAIDRRKALRDERLTEVKKQRETEDNSENLGYKDTPDNKLRIQQIKLRREKKDKLEEARFDLKTIDEEIKGFKETLAIAKTFDRSKIKSPQQLQVLDNLIKTIPFSIKDRQERAKWLNTYIKRTDEFYSKYQNDIVEKYNVSNVEASNQTRRESVAGSIKVSQQEVQRITEFQKKRPFDLSQGDPVKLQANIDRQQADLEYERVDAELLKKLRENVDTNDSSRRVEIDRQRTSNRAEYIKKLKNIQNKVNEEILDRANKYSDYIVAQRLDLSAKELEAIQAALNTSGEKDRLSPSFADVGKIKESAIERQKEDDAYAKNQQAIVNKYGNDRNESARKLFEAESKLERERHEQTVAGINFRLRNAIVENDIARRADALDRAKTIAESSTGVRSAVAGGYSAEGKSYLARVASGEVERANMQLSLAAELKAIQDFRLKNPMLGEQADFRAQNAQEKYDRAIEAQSTQLRRDREANAISLRQQVGTGQIEQMGAYSESFGARGDSYAKQSIDKQIAISQLGLARIAKLKELDDLALANEGDDKALESVRQLREEFEALNKVKLDNVEQQFSRFKGVLDEANQAGGNLIGKALVGQSSGQDWLNLLAAPFKGITDAATKFLSSEYSKIINNLLGDLVKGMDSEFGNLGGGSNNKSSIGNSTENLIGAAGSLLFGGGKSRGIDVGSLNSPYGGIFNSAPAPAAKQQDSSLWGVGFKLLGSLLGFEQGGVILPHEPEGKGDKTVIRVNANESIMVPGFTRAMGGEKGIDYLNKKFANARGFADGGVPMPLSSMPDSPMLPNIGQELSSPNLGMPSTTESQPLKLEYTKIGDRDYIDREHLESRLNQHDRRQQTRLNEYNRQKDDTMRHSLQYRRQMGLIK